MKNICIVIPLVLLLIGYDKTNNSTDTLMSKIDKTTIDSIIVLGRDPYEFTSIPIGRYAFVEYCISKNVNNRLRLMNKKKDIEDIVVLLNNLEVVTSSKQGEFSPTDFPYKPLIKGERIYLMNADSLNVKILMILYLTNGDSVPVWISQSYIDIQDQRYYSSEALVTILYDFLGYEY